MRLCDSGQQWVLASSWFVYSFFMQYICNFVLVQYYCLKIQKFFVSSNVLHLCYLSYFSIIRNLMLTSEQKDNNLSVSNLQSVELMFLFIERF